jgi:Holliday junction resolvase RusA-like endonuclease
VVVAAMKIEFTVLGEVASMKNSREIVLLGGKPALIKSQKAREYEKTASLQIPPDARQMLTGPVRATLRLYYASERPDLDEALLLDILAAKYKRTKGKLTKVADGEYTYGEGERVMVSKGVYENDRQVREKHVFHAIDHANPRAEIEIEAMQAQQVSLLDNVPLLQTSGELHDPF